MGILYYSKGTCDLTKEFVVTPEVLFNSILNIILALLISYISFESGEKTERERIKTEKAETENIKKIVHSLVDRNEKVVLSTKFEQQLSLLPPRQQKEITDLLGVNSI